MPSPSGRADMQKILLDTNFLMIPGSLNVDIFDELRRLNPSAEVLVLKDSLRELEGIEKDSGLRRKDRQAAKLALQLVSAKQIKKQIKVIDANSDSGFVDDEIVEFAVKNRVAVATQDSELKKRLSDFKLDVVVLRQHNHLKLIKG